MSDTINDKNTSISVPSELPAAAEDFPGPLQLNDVEDENAAASVLSELPVAESLHSNPSSAYHPSANPSSPKPSSPKPSSAQSSSASLSPKSTVYDTNSDSSSEAYTPPKSKKVKNRNMKRM